MKTGFKNDLALKNVQTKKSPWTFNCPQYDQRSSCFINAGSKQGVGHRQNVGREGAASNKEYIPMGKVDTMRTTWPHTGPNDLFDVKVK